MCKNNFVEFITYKTPYMLWQEHINRYIFALRFAPNKVVLDIACGTGYGAGLLSKTADLVIGVDISREALTYAKKHHGKTHNIGFILADAYNLPFRDEVFDSVVSFETIEHLIHYEKFLHEVKLVLRTGGQFIISTPNKKLSSPNEKKPQNPFHVKEFNVKEISQLLSTFSTSFQLYGQCYYTMKDWLSQILNKLLSTIPFASSFKKLRKLVKIIYKPADARYGGEKTSSSIIDPTYRVKKFRNIYPIYTPKFLIGVANK